jgi:hypothetical protein
MKVCLNKKRAAGSGSEEYNREASTLTAKPERVNPDKPDNSINGA